MAFNFDFPEGLTYTVGKNRWSTDWNYILPSLPDTNGSYQPCKGDIVFDLRHHTTQRYHRIRVPRRSRI